MNTDGTLLNLKFHWFFTEGQKYCTYNNSNNLKNKKLILYILVITLYQFCENLVETKTELKKD